ncbi:Tat pathway signal sequence domain protein [Pseudarthrobacter sp. NPDC058362]|uniref:Tat pathway signal sequence domain protein n=1 Tax=unclassified Pseudarthrobacter TaxID=2647000 RepID=UPI0036526C39
MTISPTPRQLARRTLLIAASAGLATFAAPSAMAQAANGLPRTRPHRQPPVRSALNFLDSMTGAYAETLHQPRLPQSYADELGLFSTAFVYDSALAIVAAIPAGRLDLARTIGDGLLYAQTHDPAHSDGRLRQGYNVGPYTFYDGTRNEHGLVQPDGTANIGWQFGFLGTAVGDMAWPGIALVQLHEATGEKSYLRGAQRIADWITTRAINEGTLGGFSFGVDAADQRIPNVSTEHNIDSVAFFTMLHQVDGDARWLEAANRASRLVEAMWEPAEGFFYTGSNDGSTINRHPLPLDPQTWSWLTLQEQRFAGSLDWAERTLGTTDAATSEFSELPAGFAVSGVTFSSASLTSTAVYNNRQVAPNGVWFEGTAQLATALTDRRAPRDRARANQLLQELRRAQAELGGNQHVGGTPLAPGGLVAASSLIDSGFGFGYFQIQHVGATAWYVMAELGVNPMKLGGLAVSGT